VQAASGRWLEQRYAASPPGNPLEGFIPYRGRHQDFPHSMEWSYFAWRDVLPERDRFDWRALDAFLAEAAARGHQGVFRIYADYPDDPYGVPDFLAEVPRHSYSDFSNGATATSFSPDYDDPRLLRAMIGTIRALGRRYDGDPRVGFVTVGFVGFWGEWHTYRPSCECDLWMPSARTRRRILNAFDRAFDRTKVLLRSPEVGWTGQQMGFHDDSFAYMTLEPPSWAFTAALRRAGATRQWLRQPIGGELRPEVQSCAFSVPVCTPPGQAFDDAVDTTHASWLINHYAFQPGYRGADRERALESARRLGYDLFVSAARLHDVKTSRALRAAIQIRNLGVAPFYYDWPLELGVLDDAGRLLATYRTDWRLTRVVGGEPVTFTHRRHGHGLAAGTYTLLLRIVNPLAKGTPLVLANAAWSQDREEWLTLGRFRVTAG
jgi:hypothetical protein